MNSSIMIRTAKDSDIGGMSLLLQQLFSIESDFVPDEGRQCSGLQLLLDSLWAHVLVAEAQGEIIGMVTVQIMISTAEGGYVGLVEDMVVDEQYRGQGVGTALLELLHTWAQDNGLTRLQLVADKENDAALEFYAKNGWSGTKLIVLRLGV